jgi:hypothetical protein
MRSKAAGQGVKVTIDEVSAEGPHRVHSERRREGSSPTRSTTSDTVVLKRFDEAEWSIPLSPVLPQCPPNFTQTGIVPHGWVVSGGAEGRPVVARGGTQKTPEEAFVREASLTRGPRTSNPEHGTVSSRFGGETRTVASEVRGLAQPPRPSQSVIPVVSAGPVRGYEPARARSGCSSSR